MHFFDIYQAFDYIFLGIYIDRKVFLESWLLS